MEEIAEFWLFFIFLFYFSAILICSFKREINLALL